MIKNLLKLIIILLVFIPNVNLVFAEVRETSSLCSQSSTINCIYFEENGIITQQNFSIDYEEIELIIEIFDNLIKKFEESENPDEIQQTMNRDIIQLGSFALNHPVLNWILNSINDYKLPRTKTFVISHGREIRFNPLKNHLLNLYRPLTIWHYSNRQGIEIPPKTLMIKPMPYNSRILYGNQVGIMSHFTGFYLYISQPPPQKSYTFFIGSTNRVFALDFTYINQISEFIPLALIFGVLTSTPIILVSTFALLKNSLNITEIENKKLPIADFSFYPMYPSILEEIQFYDQSESYMSKITSWIWDFGDGNTSNYQNPKHVYKNSGTFTIKLEIQDNNGNSDYTSKKVNIEKNIEKQTKNNNNEIKHENIDLNIFLILISLMIGIIVLFLFINYK